MFFSLGALNLCPAQSHFNAWFRITSAYNLNQYFRLDAEFQHRRQNGFENHNPLDKNLMFTFRSWLHYRYSKSLKFSVSPFAYFSNYRIIQTPADETAKPLKEIRFSLAAEWQQVLYRKNLLFFRSALEYRNIEGFTLPVLRLRNRIGYKYRISEKISPGIYNEFLTNVSGLSGPHWFDHNRTAATLEIRLSKQAKVDVGYIYIYRLPLNRNHYAREHVLFLNLGWEW